MELSISCVWLVGHLVPMWLQLCLLSDLVTFHIVETSLDPKRFRPGSSSWGVCCTNIPQ